ncbi:MAG: hypothetical protein GX053_14455 [Tissierella sp.]|nr:hypothetical protein [Tissierella sp.]
MSYEDRKQQRLKKRKIRNIIIISIFSLMISRTAYGFIIKNPKTILPKEEEYIVSVEAQSVLIKDETVYDIDGTMVIDPGVEEGKKVPQGFQIGKANIVKDISSLDEELKEINKAIELLNEKNYGAEVFKEDEESLASTQESLINEIQKRIKEKDYASIGDLKDQIYFTDKKLSDVSVDNTLLGQSLESLNSRKEIIIAEINNNSINYYTQKSGVISFLIDDFENMYVPKEFENYTYDKLQIPETNKKKRSDKEEEKTLNKYKIINNFNWYLAIKIDNISNVASYELNDSFYLKVADNDRELVGNIVAINQSNNKGVYIIKFNSYLYDYYDLRFPTVEIMLKRQNVYQIPSKAIIENDGQKGVYIKEFNGIVRFRPVEIIDEKDNYTFISKGNESRLINLDSENPVRTISLYDEILINPSNFNEGEILN